MVSDDQQEPTPDVRRPRFQLAARVVLAVILLGGPVLGGWVALDLFSVRSSLRSAETALREVRGSLGEVDVDTASSALAEAQADIDDAERRSGRVSWSIMRLAPFVGPTVDVTREVVEVGASSVEIATIAVTEGQALLDDGLDVAVVDGRLDLQPLIDARTLLAEMPIDRLVTARDALATPREGWLPQVVREGRADTLALADETSATLERARSVTEALPDLFGASEPRRYFLGFQTSAELRGTGGMIGFWGILGIDDGQVSFGQSEAYDPFDDVGPPEGETRTSRIRTIGLTPENPPNADPAFVARYGVFGGARSFPNVNLEPDLPTAAEAMLDLYEFQTDDRPDGVVLLDPPALQAMLQATNGGPLPLLEPYAAELGYPDGLPVDEFVSFTTAGIYDTLGFERSNERNDVLRALGDAAFLRIFDGSWDAPAMVRAVAAATSQRNLQIYTTDNHVQDALSDVGATGSLTIPPDVDQVAVTANNVVGGKQDVHLGHAFDIEVGLREVLQADGQLYVSRDLSVTTRVDNPLPRTGLDPYIIGNCYVPGGTPRCFEGEPGANRTWFTLWGRTSDELIDFDTTDPEPVGPYLTNYRGLQAYDHFLLTPSQTEGRSAVSFEGSAPVLRTTDSVVYEFAWWRQAKAIPDLLDVVVTPPDGWVIDRVEVVGGGDGRGTGVYGEGRQLTSEVVDGVARLQGTVNADTQLRVHLVAPDGTDDDNVEAAG